MEKHEAEGFYKVPSDMEPLFPQDHDKKLENLTAELISEAAKLSNSMHPVTQNAIADVLRPMNSYYSNLIEGHDTSPLDIERALKKDFSEDFENRALQMEAEAHIRLNKTLNMQIAEHPSTNIYSSDFLANIHKEFYKDLPTELKQSKTREGEIVPIVAGEIRTREVEVGRHVGPYSASLPNFMNEFAKKYDPNAKSNISKIRRIINIAASHHRLVWIHPFIDGNGRVVRLLSDVGFAQETLHSQGLWSMSRGLARYDKEYKERLANADMQRWDDYDGRGNLSDRMLKEFCVFFLEVAIDQLKYMSKALDTDNMLNRLRDYTMMMVQRRKLRAEAEYVLEAVFLKGEIPKREVERLTNKSDKTAKSIAKSLIDLDLLETDPSNRLAPYRVKYPIKLSAVLFPGLYPQDKELDMFREIDR